MDARHRRRRPGRQEVEVANSRGSTRRASNGWASGSRPRCRRSTAEGALYAWPGFGEAYGLAYLEAQAAGLPVVAQDIDGVPGVVRNGETAC